MQKRGGFHNKIVLNVKMDLLKVAKTIQEVWQNSQQPLLISEKLKISFFNLMFHCRCCAPCFSSLYIVCNLYISFFCKHQLCYYDV